MPTKVTFKMNELISAFGLSLIEIQGLVREFVPIGETGNLRASINVTDVKQFKTKLAGSVFIDPSAFRAGGVNYGPYVHEGTGIYRKENPAPIYPKTAKALAWGATLGTSATGKPIKEFVRRSIKGQPAQPFFKEAFDDYERSTADKIKALFENAIINNLQITGVIDVNIGQ